jgi:flagellar FliL protein
MSQTETSADDTPPAEPVAKPRGGRRRLLMIGAPVLLLAAAGGGWFAFGSAASHGPAPVAYMLLDPITVNLRSPDGRPRFLRVKLALEIKDASVREHVHEQLPKILDGMLMAMRELTPEDVTGSAGLYVLKEELLVRAHAAVGPGEVRQVLVQEVVQQ